MVCQRWGETGPAASPWGDVLVEWRINRDPAISHAASSRHCIRDVPAEHLGVSRKRLLLEIL